MLDTDTCIALIRGKPTSARRRFRATNGIGEEMFVSSITLSELWYGVDHSRDVDANTERLMDFLSGPIEILDFNELDSARAGLVRSELADAGKPIGPYDLLIAAQTVRREHTLATGNIREFNRVSGLATESWL